MPSNEVSNETLGREIVCGLSGLGWGWRRLSRGGEL
jgi:hypothetical protein